MTSGPDPNARPSQRYLWLAVCLVVVAVPFLATEWLPFADLAQHMAQVRLFGEEGYRLQWWTPYTLVYPLLAVSAGLFEPLVAARMGALLVALLSCAAIHFLAARMQRSVAGAILASVFVFNHALYWGFLPFVLGWVVFCVWLVVVDRRRDPSPREALLFFAGSALLWSAHALWFVAGMVWLGLEAVVQRRPPRSLWPRAVGVLPLVVFAPIWLLGFTETGFAAEQTEWLSLAERLGPEALVESALGGLKGAVEPVLLGVVVLWLILGMVQNRRDLRSRVCPALLWPAAFFLILFVALPDKFTNTIYVNRRALPLALILLLLAAPTPRLAPGVLRGLAAVVLAAFAGFTTTAWRTFAREDMAGLRECLEALPKAPRLIGLDCKRRSDVVRGRPFLQAYAYSQLLRGGELNFSFADLPHMPVVFAERRQQIGDKAVWNVEVVKYPEVQHYDFALVNGTQKHHGLVLSTWPLQTIVTGARWRLYRVPR